MSSETNKILSPPGAFLQHLKSPSFPLVLWHSANLSITMTVDHLLHGCEMKENGILIVVCTHDSIAPEGVVELASCNCNGDSSKGWCIFKKSNVPYGNLCSCGDKFQNTDVPPPTLALNVDNDYEKLGKPDKCTEEELKKLEEYIQQIEELGKYKDSC